MDRSLKKIILARHFGFCMGVKRAIQIAEETGAAESGPVNVINEIVHNDSVVRKLSANGVGSVTAVAAAPAGTVIVSAHGAPPSVFSEAQRRGLKVIDATCPLVIRIHKIIHKLIDNGFQIIHFGDHHHDETIGVLGQAPDGRIVVVSSPQELRALAPNGRPYALTSQTTAGVAEFEEIAKEAQSLFPGIEVCNTICDATSQRQAAVLDLAPEVNVMIVVGSASSANSNRLRSICEAICGHAYLINSAAELQDSWFGGMATVGVTAGASTPDFLVEEVIQKLFEYSGQRAEIIRPEKKKNRLALLRERPAAEE